MKIEPCKDCDNPEARTMLMNIAVTLHNSSVALQAEEKWHRETKAIYEQRLKEKGAEIARLKRELQHHIAKHGAWKRVAGYWKEKYRQFVADMLPKSF